MDDLLKIDISFPVPRFSCLPFMISFRSYPRVTVCRKKRISGLV
jgi:hypothetical protein